MAHSSVVTIRDSNGIRWQVSAAYAPIFLAPRTPDPRQLLRERTEQLIKRSPMRMIFAASIPAGKKELPVVIKIYRRGRLGDWIKANLLGSKARREWRITTAAAERGLPTVIPVAYGERRRFGVLWESYLLTVRLFNCVTLEEALFSEDGTLRADAKTRRQLIRLLAALLRRMHDDGIYHQDLHPGNFLVETLPVGEKRIHLLDLHRASLRPTLALKNRIKSLAQFNMFASISLGAAERLLFFNSYFGEDEPWRNEKRALLTLIDKRTRIMRWRLWKRREARCLYNNRYFMRLRFENLSGFARREEWKGEIAQILLTRDMAGSGASLVKDSRSKSIWEKEVVIQGVPRTLFIKHYRRKRGWQAIKYLCRRSQAIRSWAGAYAIQIRNINAVNAIATIEERRAMHCLGDAYLLTDKIPSVENLAAALAKLAGPSPEAREARRELLRSLALFFRRIHSLGIYHGDTKATNILVGKDRSGSRALYLTDLDFVRTKLRLPRRNVLRNLVQLNSSIRDLSHAGAWDRLCFLKAYLGARRRKELRPMWEAIARRTEKNLKKRKRRFSAKLNHR
jgi:tRNA A-37 threonylcarbamoyl transferase component Bud32